MTDVLLTARGLGWQLPNESGVYCIRNTVSGRVYVGSAKGMRRRLGRHVRLLDRGKHHSVPLQSAWNKHGPQAFECSVLELANEEARYERENYWIERLGAYMGRGGYNMLPAAHGSTNRILTEENKRKLLEGQQQWRAQETVGQRNSRLRAAADAISKEYIVCFPDGAEQVVKNLKAFCRERGLPYASMIRAANLRQHWVVGAWQARPVGMSAEEAHRQTCDYLTQQRREYWQKAGREKREEVWAIYKDGQLLAVFNNGRAAAEYLDCPYYSVLQARLKDRPLTRHKLKGIHISSRLLAS